LRFLIEPEFLGLEDLSGSITMGWNSKFTGFSYYDFNTHPPSIIMD
jgi:hypothetical protein